MISSINNFKAKLDLWIIQLKKRETKHFLFLTQHIKSTTTMVTQDIYDEYVSYLQLIKEEFDNRFKDFEEITPLVIFLTQPFSDFDIEILAEQIGHFLCCTSIDVESELLQFLNDIDLKANFNCNDDFWKLVQSEIYPIISKLASAIFSSFGSTYLCEAGFSAMNMIKNKYRNKLTDEHLTDCMRLALSNYVPEYVKLIKEMQSSIPLNKFVLLIINICINLMC